MSGRSLIHVATQDDLERIAFDFGLVVEVDPIENRCHLTVDGVEYVGPHLHPKRAEVQ